MDAPRLLCLFIFPVHFLLLIIAAIAGTTNPVEEYGRYSYLYGSNGFMDEDGVLGVASMASANSTIGVNYGMVADNLPPPQKAMELLKSLGISKVKLYSANSSTLQAFAKSGVSFIVGIGNEDLHSLSDSRSARAWVETHIIPYLSTIHISAIAVGNEILTINDSRLVQDLLPAMLSLHSALAEALPASYPRIAISTPHSLGILSSSYPPSAARFDPSAINSLLHPLALFLSQTQSPFMINAYPFFSYKYSPTTISLPYTLFLDNPGVKDMNSGLVYYNMLDAQVDAVYYALEAMGFPNIKVIVTETGWPSKGDASEPGATKENAQLYNANLMKHLARHRGTPKKPGIPLEAYIFALFNEDSKPGPESERHYGLFKPDGTEAYDLGLRHDNPSQLASHNTFISFSSDCACPCLTTLISRILLSISLYALLTVSILV
ncbi:hypothetical protein KP509_32G018300 [Ceratopteris richardii]|uniref:glucan endo-1,3-beta-D-glucosidase n=1 Tax=Ceratopteris richardii TaxID=49495 RepID=A0A8T2QSV4_CERRI|nr:hypothetical protein KP509_32G018300 [Ceratopteris richardii]